MRRRDFVKTIAGLAMTWPLGARAQTQKSDSVMGVAAPIFDFEIPYNIFTGLWTCTATMYNPKGDFIRARASNVAIYWVEPYTHMHFRQTDPKDVKEMGQALGLPAAAARLASIEFDLEIEGKSAKGGVPGLVNIGAETTPDTYIFHLTYGDYALYNNHYVGTANEQRVIGPLLHEGEVQFVISQFLMRIDYHVPDEFKRAVI